MEKSNLETQRLELKELLDKEIERMKLERSMIWKESIKWLILAIASIIALISWEILIVKPYLESLK